jgi:hypothetical protein
MSFSIRHNGHMLRKAAIVAIICGTAFLLSGCGSISSWLAEKLADNVPAWAGGLPPGAPPRPSDPGYAQYENEQRAKAVVDAEKASADAETITNPAH